MSKILGRAVKLTQLKGQRHIKPVGRRWGRAESGALALRSGPARGRSPGRSRAEIPAPPPAPRPPGPRSGTSLIPCRSPSLPTFPAPPSSAAAPSCAAAAGAARGPAPRCALGSAARPHSPQRADEPVDGALRVQGHDVPDVQKAGHFLRHSGSFSSWVPRSSPSR